MDDRLYRLLSIESDVPRPRLLKQGSLAACLDELKEAVLLDVTACNRGTLSIVAVYESVDGRHREIDVPLATTTTTGTGA